MRPILPAALILWTIFIVPADARTRAQTHWGGSDLFVSCDTVRGWRGAVESMSAAQRAALARKFNVTRKQIRQARACLRGG